MKVVKRLSLNFMTLISGFDIFYLYLPAVYLVNNLLVEFKDVSDSIVVVGVGSFVLGLKKIILPKKDKSCRTPVVSIEGESALVDVEGETVVVDVVGETTLVGVVGETAVVDVVGETALVDVEGETALVDVEGETALVSVEGETVKQTILVNITLIL